MGEKNVGRRETMRRVLVVIGAAPLLASGLEACSGGELACSGNVTTAQLVVRGALHYADHGADPSRHCSACQLYSGDASSCGTCSSVPGSVNPGGTCDAFTART